MPCLPVIVGFGGISPAGRSSFHHAYRRLVADALSQQDAADSWRSLAGLMGLSTSAGAPDADQIEHIRSHTLVRRIEPDWFDTENAPGHTRARLAGEQGIRICLSKRQLPPVLPEGWRQVSSENGEVEVEIPVGAELLLPVASPCSVRAAGQLPTGFDPAALYPARGHPRGLQMAVYAASDALNSTGLDWESLVRQLSPGAVSVYAGSTMGQLDHLGYGGMLQARWKGQRVSARCCPFGLPGMTADFVNAYVLGNTGNTSSVLGACATVLYNLRLAAEDIRAGRARIALVGASEAPITAEIIEGYAAMGALATDEGLLALEGRTEGEPDHRRACRPFGENCGFTIAESSQFFVLFDEELALSTGAPIHGAVWDVAIHADGYKKSISSPGVGNYLTMARAAASAKALLGEKALQQRSFVLAHGTGTPQNRVTESKVLDRVAEHFGIESWPLAAVKCYLGHSIATAAGDQMMAGLGAWRYGWLPGISTIEEPAADVSRRHLSIESGHRELGLGTMDVALVNSKGFGGNNASAVLLAPEVAERMLADRHGQRALTAWRRRAEEVAARGADLDAAASRGESRPVYRFGEGVLDDSDVRFSEEGIHLSGFAQAMPLAPESSSSDSADPAGVPG